MGMRERHESSASGRNIRPCALNFNNNNLPPPLEFSSNSAKEKPSNRIRSVLSFSFGAAVDVLEVVLCQALFQFGGVNGLDRSFPMNENLFDASAGKRFLQALCQYFDFG